jgi:hypothetical protein
MPRLITPVSMRTMYGALLPSASVVCSTLAGGFTGS